MLNQLVGKLTLTFFIAILLPGFFVIQTWLENRGHDKSAQAAGCTHLAVSVATTGGMSSAPVYVAGLSAIAGVRIPDAMRAERTADALSIRAGVDMDKVPALNAATGALTAGERQLHTAQAELPIEPVERCRAQ